ncbi:MAG TPA: hypothetical protein VFB17_03125 [Gaiellaceae bacterium]|nr:hypothetical protein [Gaiellaceae bacterium]
MKLVRGFGRFWWDFVVGDDWKIAAGVVIALAIGAGVAAGAATGARWIAPVVGACVPLLFALVVVADVRSR